MAQVILDKLWLHLADDLGTYLALPVQPVAETDAADAEVRRYGRGRDVLVVRPGQTRTIPITLRRVSWADLQTLRSWTGRLLMLRDLNGRKAFGVYRQVDATDVRAEQLAETVSLTFQTVTYDEEV